MHGDDTVITTDYEGSYSLTITSIEVIDDNVVSEDFNPTLYNDVAIYRNVNNSTLIEIIEYVESYPDYKYIVNFTTSKTCEGLGFPILSQQDITNTEEVYQYSTALYSRHCADITEKSSSIIYGENNIIIGWNPY